MEHQVEFFGGPVDGWTTSMKELPRDVGDHITYGLEVGVSVGAFYANPKQDSRYMHLYQCPMPSYATLDDSEEVIDIFYVGIHQVMRLDEFGACDIIWDDE